MDVNKDGDEKVTAVKPEQPEKIELPIEVTDAGISTAVSLMQPLKAELPMVVKEDGV
jgi:hypothetical protein